MQLVIIIIVILLLLGGTGPWYPYSRGWGYYPMGGGLGLVLIILLILWLTGRI